MRDRKADVASMCRTGYELLRLTLQDLASILTAAVWRLYGLPGLRRIRNTWLLIRQGMAETAQRFTSGSRGVVTAHFLLYGRIHFVNRWFEAQQVFNSGALHARLGDTAGLKVLGMHRKGIIWNNDDEKWKLQRSIFTKAVQDRRDEKRREVARLCQEATQLTLREAREATGNSVVPLYGLDLLRCITCRVTLGLAFGLEPGALSHNETLQLVRKVNAFFKAWEFFLLRPGWYLWTLRRWEALRHSASIAALRAAVEEVILQRATAGRWPPAAPPSDSPDGAAPTALAEPNPCFLRDIWRHVADGRLSREEAVQLALEMLIAGTDTSSVTMFYALLGLRDDPQLQLRLWQELRSRPEGPCYELRDLPILRAVLSESMRFKPVGPVVIRQATESLCLTPTPEGRRNGQQPQNIGSGDTVVVNLAHMHCDREIFDYPDTFDVRNFLGPPRRGDHDGDSDAYAAARSATPSTDVCAGGPDRAFLPFGSGRKGCVGFLLAQDEMSAIMWSLAQEVQELPPLAHDPGPISGQGHAAKAPQSEATRQLGGRLAPRLAELEIRWEVANQPREELLLEFRFRGLPVGPATPERPARPPRSLPGWTRRVARGAAAASPQASLSYPPQRPTEPATAPLPAVLSLLAPVPRQIPQPQPQSQPLRKQLQLRQQHQKWPSRRCLVYLTGAGGVGKTTVMQDVAGELLELGFSTRTELLQAQGIGRSQLEQDNAVFLRFQEDLIRAYFQLDVLSGRSTPAGPHQDGDPDAWGDAVEGFGTTATVGAEVVPEARLAEASAHEHVEEGAAGHGGTLDGHGALSDRSALDAVFYVAARFGADSDEVRKVVAMPEMQQLLQLYRNGVPVASTAAVGGLGDAMPGSKLQPGVTRCLHVLVRPFQTEAAATGRPQQRHQHAVQEPLRRSYIVEKGGQEGVEEAGGAEGGSAPSELVGGVRLSLSAVEDDGVRLCASLGQLRDHTMVAEGMLQRLGVPYTVLRERDRDGRRRELLRILEEVADGP